MSEHFSRKRALTVTSRSGLARSRRGSDQDSPNHSGRESEAAEEALRLVGAGVWEVDLNTGRSTWSDELYRLLRVDAATAEPGAPAFLAAVHRDDRRQVAERIDRAISQHTAFALVHRLRRGTGRERRVQTRARICATGPGPAARLLVVVLPAPIDPGVARQPSAEASEMADEVRRLKAGTSSTPREVEAAMDRVSPGPDPSTMCMIHVIEDDAVRCVAASPVARFGSDGAPIPAGGICSVLLQRDELRRQARDAVDTREWVLDILAHDIRAPLNHIALGAAMILTNGVAADSVTSYAGVIQRSAFRMNRLIQDLLDVSATAAGTLALELRPEPVASLLEEVQCTASMLTSGEVRVHAPADLPSVPMDRDRLLQVLFNLVGNAIKFSPDGSDLELRVTVRETEVLFSLSDQGVGIATDQTDAIFKPYWTSTESAREGGRGLGLAIARLIVEGHDGRIWVESKPGVGSTFHFTIAR